MMLILMSGRHPTPKHHLVDQGAITNISEILTGIG